MSIQLLKKGSNTDPDMEQYNKNLRRHHLRNIGIAAVIVCLAVLFAWGIQIGLQHRTYDVYEVVRSFERSDTVMTQYTEFGTYVLKYSRDGISCVDSSNNLVWSQTYNMQNPMVDICGNSAAVADENGTEAMVFSADGLLGSFQTLLPIRSISVSSQGVLACLLEDGESMRLNLYSSEGEELVTSHFDLQDTGYPVQMSLSSDAAKLAVSFLQIQNGTVNTYLAFYNFGSVGENYEDHLVAARTLEGAVVPSVKYVDATHCFAVGTTSLLLYEGSQIPELVQEIPLDREVESVFYSDDAVGLVLPGQEQAHALRVYNTQGNMEFETEFDLDYGTLKFSGANILIYNEFECLMINRSGTVFFTTTFDESISNLYTLSGNQRFILMHASRTDQIRLK